MRTDHPVARRPPAGWGPILISVVPAIGAGWRGQAVSRPSSRGRKRRERKPTRQGGFHSARKPTAAFWREPRLLLRTVRTFAAGRHWGRSRDHTPVGTRNELDVGANESGLDGLHEDPTQWPPAATQQVAVMDFVELIRELLRVVAEDLLIARVSNLSLYGVMVPCA